LPKFIDLATAQPHSLLPRPIIALATRCLAVDWFDRAYARFRNEADPTTFTANSLRFLNAEYQVDPAAAPHIPRRDSLVIIANHPFGCLDGLILADFLAIIRPDFKMFGNHFLQRLAPLRDHFIFVDPFAGPAAARANAAPMRHAVRWLTAGHALLTFPAGEVAHWRPPRLSIVDAPWNTTIARLLRRTRAPVLPIFVDGRNSALFQVAGVLHPLIRTAMLLRELRNKRGRRITLRVGPIIPFDELESLTPAAMTSELRNRTLSLGQNRRPTPIISHPSDRPLLAEIDALDPQFHLLRAGDCEVLCASADRIPRVLDEIGRLREIAFRAAGEGTGRQRDLDRFDRTYLHLFLWHHRRRQLIGAYRLGLCDQLLADSGPSALYTATLFDLRPALLRQLPAAIELGRSFIHPDDQRTHQPLMLLWKGIARFLAMHQRYAILIGAVSISQNYRDLSRQLIIDLLFNQHRLPRARLMARPRHPWPAVEVSHRAKDIRDLDRLLATIEPDAKRIPVLLRQYLALGAKLIACNIDPDFGNCLDALMYADLRATDPRLLTRYMGARESQAFLAFHIMNSRQPDQTLRQPLFGAPIPR
jgi:putative hemolysin